MAEPALKRRKISSDESDDEPDVPKVSIIAEDNTPPVAAPARNNVFSDMCSSCRTNLGKYRYALRPFEEAFAYLLLRSFAAFQMSWMRINILFTSLYEAPPKGTALHR